LIPPGSLRSSILQLSRRPGQGPSAEQVDVEVEDRLSRSRADVENGAVSLLDVALACNLCGGEVAAADDCGISGVRFLQSGKMFLRNNEDVRGRLRIDVFEGEDVGVFVNFLGGNLAAKNAAKEAVRDRVSHGWLKFLSDGECGQGPKLAPELA
jgi:hypothetical protein